jgi:lipopolysaccharide transport system ATP-binding protein
MKRTILFDRVSKRYRLGLTRTSLPSVISGWLGKALRPGKHASSQEQLLWALRDVSFEMKQGDSLAFIGPNGAGKTTVLKLLANITKPTFGTIETSGKLSALIELGAGFHPDLTGRENIFLNGAILGLRRSEIKRRFDEIVAFSEIEPFLDTPVKRYSSGMSVRLGFAVASCIKPEILLVDEVLAVGDASFRQKCVNRIQELVRNGTSIIFVSHNLWLVQAVCTSAIYLEKGEVKCRGEVADVIGAYDRAINEQRARQFDDSQLEPANTAGEVEITKIEVVDTASNLTEELANDRPVEVRVAYVAFRELGEVNVVVRLVRSDGLTCCMVRSGPDGAGVVLRPGAGVVSLLLDPLQLYGGAYFAQVIIRDIADAGGITTANSDWFYVGGSVLSHSTMNGVFEPRRRWAHCPSALEVALPNGRDGWNNEL